MAASPGVYFLAVLLLVCRCADADDFLLAGPGYYSGAPIRSLEMLQTGENGMGCEGRVPDFPYELQDEYMAVIDEKVTVCGGVERQVMDECWQLEVSSDRFSSSWVKTEPMEPDGKYGGGSVFNAEGDWFIVPRATDSTAVYKIEEEEWVEGPPTLDEGELSRDNFCVAQVNETHTFMGGGFFNGQYSSDAFMFDWNKQRWKQTPSMLIERESPQCIGLGDGRIMAAGGVTEFTVEVYNPATESWSFIGDLPIGRDNGALVLHNGEVLLAGGYSFDVSQYPPYITRYDAEEDVWVEELDWPQMSNGRSSFPLLSVSDEYLPTC